MNKVYIIKPDLNSLPKKLDCPKEIQVIFSSSKPRLSGRSQTVTTCIFRNHLTQIGIGCTVSNPNDITENDEGRRWAYKRAIQSMINNVAFRKKKWYVNRQMRKSIDHIFRTALRRAKEK